QAHSDDRDNKNAELQNPTARKPAKQMCLVRLLFHIHQSSVLALRHLPVKFFNALFHDWTEMTDQPLHWPRSGITERTNCMTFNFTRYIQQHVNFFYFCIPTHHAFHHTP